MNKRTLCTLLILCLLVPALIITGTLLFREKGYLFLAFGVAILTMIPLFYAFEKKENTPRELAVLACLIALSVVGRFLFAFLPFFKPVTAITIIAGLYLGKEAGFVTGALSALVSNFYFGQGPWTPFQMFAWGLIGLLAGLLARPNERNALWALVYGLLSGLVYSLGMDVFTALWMDGDSNAARYGALVLTALPITAEYAVSNVLFLLVLRRPMGEKLTRIKRKYGLFSTKKKSANTVSTEVK